MTAPSPLAASGLVALGGGAGAVLRYQAGRGLTALLGPAAVTAFPWATLLVNVSGSLAMGLLAGWLARHGSGGESARLLLGVERLGDARLLRRLCGSRGDAQHLPGLEPVGRIGALAVDPQLPGPRPAADRGEADLGQVAAEPAVEANPLVVGPDGELANFRRHARRIAISPR
jgi:hypothetical protein